MHQSVHGVLLCTVFCFV